MSNTEQKDNTADLQAQIAKLQAENAALQKAAVAKISATVSCKVSDKGALSLYGLQRFPVTLYKTQWNALLENADKIKAFIKANDAKLVSNKPPKTEAPAQS